MAKRVQTKSKKAKKPKNNGHKKAETIEIKTNGSTTKVISVGKVLNTEEKIVKMNYITSTILSVTP